jgi:hypothetical protein
MSPRISVAVRVIARAGANRVEPARAGRVVVRVTAAPEGGAANRAVQATLARELGLRPADVSLERGATSRDKVFGLPASASARLARLLK